MKLPAITVRLDPDRPNTPFRVNVPATVAVDGRRFRRWFVSEGQARRFAAEQERATRNHTDRALKLTEGQKEEAARCFALVAEHGRTLLDAVNESVVRWQAAGASLTLPELRAALMVAKRQDGRTEAHLRGLDRCLRRFEEAFPGRVASSILPQEVDAHLRGLAVNPVSRDSYRTLIGVAFAFAVRQGWAKENPVLLVDKAGGVGREARILSPEEFSSLIRVADPRLVPWIVLGAFAGLRPFEAMRTTVDDLRGDFIVLSAGKTKTRARRRIPILPALRAWLGAGPFTVPSRMTIRRMLRKASLAAGFARWPQDCLRKSWISYRLALTNDENGTAMEAGNSPAIILRYYRSLTDAETAERWFALRPEKCQ